jgi:hypothetical protein
MEGEPLIDDDTSPYPRPVFAEEFIWKGHRSWEWAKIVLVTLNERWSFAADFTTLARGAGFDPWLKFCIPYPDRSIALVAAVNWLHQHEADSNRDLGSWMQALLNRQLELFPRE